MVMSLRPADLPLLTRALSLTAALLAPLAAQASCAGMLLYAHRGHPDAPENSQSSVTRALDGAWDGVEIDIQQLRDGHWVLHSDPQLDRTTTLRGRVQDLSSTAWGEILLKDRMGRLTRESAPFLSDVLEKVDKQDGSKVLNVELKQPSSFCGVARQAVSTLNRGLPGGNWFLTATDRGQLQCARQFDPEGYLGQIVPAPQAQARRNAAGDADGNRLAQPLIDETWLRRLQQDVGKPVGIHIDATTLRTNPELLAMARTLGMPVFTHHMGPDSEHFRALRDARRRTGLLPTGAVIDGQPTVFCDGVNLP